jgi:hypothetical protein
VTKLTEILNSISIDNLATRSSKTPTNLATPSGYDELKLFASKMEDFKESQLRVGAFHSHINTSYSIIPVRKIGIANYGVAQRNGRPARNFVRHHRSLEIRVYCK